MISSKTPALSERKSPDTSDLNEFLHTLESPFISDSVDEYTIPTQTQQPTAAYWNGLPKDRDATTASSYQSSPHSDPQEGPSSHTPPHSGSAPRDSDEQPTPEEKVEADACCEICGYRPKGHPQWFKGSMMKHKKNMHSEAPPQIYKCPFPGCTSRYKNRPDNLRQHQLDKGHFVDGEETCKRPSKRKKI